MATSAYTYETVEGTVLRIFPCGESDLVVRLLTPNRGKIAVIAKYVRKSKKRFASGLDLFDRGRFSIRSPHSDSNSTLAVLQDFAPEGGYRELRVNIGKIVGASLLCECYDFLIPEHVANDPEAYRLLQLGLTAVDAATDLKQTLKGCFVSICQLMLHSGFVSTDQLPAPSANGLLSLVRLVEAHAERELASKPSLIEVLGQLRAVNTSTRPNDKHSQNHNQT